MALTSSLSVSVSAELTAALDLGTARAPLAVRRAVTLADGTGPGRADLLWSDRRTLAASASEDLDLAGALVDAFGRPVTLARVKGLVLTAADTNPGGLVVGAAAANAWSSLLGATGTVTLRPGAILAVAAGSGDGTAYPVTAGTADLLHIANASATEAAAYDVVLIGAST